MTDQITPDTPGPDFEDVNPDGLLPGLEEKTREFVKQAYLNGLSAALGQVPRPINWRNLPPADLERELLELNAWVDCLRHTYGLPRGWCRRCGTASPNSCGNFPR